MKTDKSIQRAAREYENELYRQERAAATISKYRHDIKCFLIWLRTQQSEKLEKETVIAYKTALTEKYAPESVNSMLAALNGFLEYIGRHDCRVKPLKIQTRVYADSERELTKAEYERLLCAARARGDARLYNLLQTICSTGIRVSELVHVTAEAVQKGSAVVNNKGKSRIVFLPAQLCRRLTEYCRKNKITHGSVFITRSGSPLNRSNIWAMMKSLCAKAGVAARKVFPHNLRHLFARCFYKLEHDLDHLASVLGHSNINTTRIYTKSSGAEHRSQIELLNLVE